MKFRMFIAAIVIVAAGLIWGAVSATAEPIKVANKASGALVRPGVAYTYPGRKKVDTCYNSPGVSKGGYWTATGFFDAGYADWTETSGGWYVPPQPPWSTAYYFNGGVNFATDVQGTGGTRWNIAHNGLLVYIKLYHRLDGRDSLQRYTVCYHH